MSETRTRRDTENESKIEVVQIDGLVNTFLKVFLSFYYNKNYLGGDETHQTLP